ncbi:hypothetical protein OG948_39335 (plasmid) [Embleya sp. NBC_00888]|uniref:hypothetical protein n=1 Tax=Embleya sp. NBC_00888 TaxID=2975960 RepID=UPI002F90A566|nr:hypothetical protein OG948_39335 [Embleya sp. NBC_00888]
MPNGPSREPLSLDFFSLFEGGQSLTLRHFVHHDSPDADDARDLATLLDHAVHGKPTGRVPGFSNRSLCSDDQA